MFVNMAAAAELGDTDISKKMHHGLHEKISSSEKLQRSLASMI